MPMKVFAPGEVLTASDVNEYLVNSRFAVATATETANNNATPHDDGQLYLPGLSANATYVVQMLLIYSTSGNGNPDFKYGFSLPVGASFSALPGGLDPTATAAAGTSTGAIRMDVFTSSTKSLAAIQAVDVGAFPLFLLVMGGTAGTLQVQWSQSVAVSENTQRKANSFIWARRVA